MHFFLVSAQVTDSFGSVSTALALERPGLGMADKVHDQKPSVRSCVVADRALIFTCFVVPVKRESLDVILFWGARLMAW